MWLCFVLSATSLLLRVIVLLSGAWPLSAFFLTPCRLEGLIAGLFVALVWLDPVDWARLQWYAERLMLGSGGLVLGIALGQRHFILDMDPRHVGHEVVVGCKNYRPRHVLRWACCASGGCHGEFCGCLA
jgi:hypothetical protein